MKKKRVYHLGKCPICEQSYVSKNHGRTKHHIFPQTWYGVFGLTVFACVQCHVVEFDIMFPMDKEDVWSESKCVQNWVKFCKSKGKDAYVIYPELKNLKPLR